MINLPDWLAVRAICPKSKKRFFSGALYVPEHCPVPSANLGWDYMIWFKLPFSDDIIVCK